jgi:hypothetical protein
MKDIKNYQVSIRDDRKFWVTAERMVRIMDDINAKRLFWITEEINFPYYMYEGMRRANPSQEITALREIGLISHTEEPNKGLLRYESELSIHGVIASSRKSGNDKHD